MESVRKGQCGLCIHFGETHARTNVLVSITTSNCANLKLLDECGHPRHASLRLKVSAISGCDGFFPIAA